MDEGAWGPERRFAKDVLVLAVGVEGIGKSMLAKALLKESSRHEIPPIKMKVNMLSKISPDFELLDVDLVAVLIDLTKACSLEVLENLGHLEYRHLLGKLCFIILGTLKMGRFCVIAARRVCDRVINVGDIAPKLMRYNSPVFYCGFKNEAEFEILSPKLMNIVMAANGLKQISTTTFSWNCGHPLSAPDDLIGDS